MKLAILLAAPAALALSACTLTPEQQARLQLAEKQAAGLGDKLLKVGVLTGYITPQEAAQAREIGTIIVSPAPPTPPAATSGKGLVVDVTSGK